MLAKIKQKAIDELATGLESVVTGTKTLGQAIKDVFKNMAQMLVKMAAQKAIQKLFSFFGNMGKGNKGNASGAVDAVRGLVPGFNSGGMVPMKGFKKGVDSVPAMLTPGEGVLTTKEIAALGGPRGFESFRKAIKGYNTG